MNDFLSFLSGLTMQMVFLLSLGYVAYAICQRWISGSSVGIRWCATCIVFCWLLSILFSILVSAHMWPPPATAVTVIALVLTSRGRLKPMACVRSSPNDWSACREIIILKDSCTEEPDRHPDLPRASTPLEPLMQPQFVQDGPLGHGRLIDGCLWWAALTCFLLLAVLLTV